MTSHFLADDRFAIAVPEAFLSLLSNVSDAAFVTDASGVVEDVIWNVGGTALPERESLVGRTFEELLTEESRDKARQMIADARSGERPRWRELNHSIEGVGEIPMRYQAIPAGEMVMFLGREQRSVAEMQSKLVQAQRALDDEYNRLRQLETRYRVLFQTSTEALLVVDPRTRQVQEANVAAGRLFDRSAGALAGHSVESLVAGDDAPRVREALERIAATGEQETVASRLAAHDRPVELRATLFRAADAPALLFRVSAVGDRAEEADVEDILARLAERLPDAIVLVEPDGRIVWSNDAFLGLAELVLPIHAQGQPLSRFLGRPGVDLGIIVANALERGRLRAFSLILHGAFGGTTEVEVSVASLPDSDPPLLGFVMRDVSRLRPMSEQRPKPPAPQAVDELMHLVGSMPLKELVRASTEEIEKMCIEAALQLTGNNRASAAEMLGLSRQSLYVKLRRFGFMDDHGGED